MSEPQRLSLRELEAYGRVWGEGRERRALCPFCGDEHKRDRAHACLAVNTDTGAWTCHRCNRSGLLDENKTGGDRGTYPAAKGRPRVKPRPLPPQVAEPSPADVSEEARKRARLRRLWADTVPLADALAVGARTYLQRRGVPADVAEAARVRYSPSWGSGNTFIGHAVVFPMQDEGGRLVAAEGRFMTPPGDVAKAHSAGTKSHGVFAAMPGALEAQGVTLCEGPITALSVAACGFPALALCGHTRAPAWLVPRFALQPVFLAFDYGEQGADTLAQRLARELTALGATPYRLTPPADAGDWNDYLQAVGLEAMRRELTDAICDALAPGA